MLAMAGLTQAKGWRGIVPLHSTRMDVERLLGSPRESRGVASTYETENERVLVFYSGEPCKKDGEWDVPRDTVVSFTVSPKTKLLVAGLKLDETKYKRALDYHVQGVVYYSNREEGIRIETRLVEREDEFVDSISYEPAAKDNYRRCPSARRLSDGDADVATPPPSKFDEYSNIPFSDEKARLDNFAIYLQKEEPEFKGYIIVYAGRSTRSGGAQARAKRAKDYLVKVRGIEAARIVTIDGGCRDQLEVELYVLPAAMSPLTPNPYRHE